MLSVDQHLYQADNNNRIDADSPTLEELEKRYILNTLNKFNGNREQTASLLGINKSTLWRKLQSWQADNE